MQGVVSMCGHRRITHLHCQLARKAHKPNASLETDRLSNSNLRGTTRLLQQMQGAGCTMHHTTDGTPNAIETRKVSRSSSCRYCNMAKPCWPQPIVECAAAHQHYNGQLLQLLPLAAVSSAVLQQPMCCGWADNSSATPQVGPPELAFFI